MIRVAVDALGGDRAPDEIVAGAARRVVPRSSRFSSGRRASTPTACRSSRPEQASAWTRQPVEAVRAKPDSSLVRAVRAVADGEADALRLGREARARRSRRRCSTSGAFRRVYRPAIAVVIPARAGPTVLIDAGANADARPEHLLQFGHMGAVFAEEILGIADPEVRLLSIGEEDEKGNELTLEAHELLRASDLRFGGNTESRRLLEGDADVVVADGFTGNVALKAIEGTIRSLLDAMRGELESSVRGKLGGLLIRPGRAARPDGGSTRRSTAARTCSGCVVSW